MDSKKFETERKQFEKNFGSYKHKNIVLYGLGRRTASTVEAMKDYHFIGLMDREPENIGKIFFELPVLSQAEAEEKADIVIINTAESYWRTIYKRIQGMETPIFFLNGRRACAELLEEKREELEYWRHSLKELEEAASSCHVVSFDIFDTLVMRRVYLPEDVFRLLELYPEGANRDFAAVRKRARGMLRKEEYLLEDLYEQIQRLTGWTQQEMEGLAQREAALEELLLAPRTEMVSLMDRLREKGKEIYLISDMYLAEAVLLPILKRKGIEIDGEHLLISGELGASKKQGKLWRHYKDRIAGRGSAMHIGDDPAADLSRAQEAGIRAFQVMSISEMLRCSSLREAENKSCGLFASLTMGLLTSYLFRDPFALNDSKGKIVFQEFEDMGYCLYGPVILSYLLWMIQKGKELHRRQFVFLARDGYFLLEDYYLLHSLLAGVELPDAVYLPVSRRLAMIAAVEDPDSFREAAFFPYNGLWEEYLQDRFCIEADAWDEHRKEAIVSNIDQEKIMEWLRPYEDRLKTEIQQERNYYADFLKGFSIHEGSVFIDVGYYGNTQYYLNKILNANVPGFYCCADLSEDNIRAAGGGMYACFQDSDDKRADHCCLYKQTLVLESFLTAPWGMLQRVDRDGSLIYDKNKKNQEFFHCRVNINKGVRQYIRDFMKLLPEGVCPVPDPRWADTLFGLWLEGGMELSQEIRDSFYWDNGLVQRRESKIFD